jgi:probable HAF family extracellular repeat protein
MLNPPPPSFETCKTVGNGFMCDGARTESYGPARHRRTTPMNTRLATVMSAAAVTAAVLAAAPAAAGTPARAAAQYPYRLVDPGTFGGPQSFLNLPAVPLTPGGALLGTADTAMRDADYPKCNPFMIGFPDKYVAHAFEWRGGRLHDLGALPGNNSSAVFEVNGSGVGVGMSETAITDPNTGWPADHAVMFKGGKVIDLGTLPGGYESQANDINNRGQVSGFASNGIRDKYSFFTVFSNGPGPCGPSGWVTQARSFVWRGGVMRDIGTLGGPDAVSTTQNAAGQVTGQSWTSSTPNPGTGIPTLDPFLWTGGHMRDLGTLGGTVGMAIWLNNRGEVVGQSNLAGDQTAHPFLWANGHMRDLGTLGGSFGAANWVNDRGAVAGWAQAADQNFHGFLWRNGHMRDLPPVGGAPWAFANSVNDQGQVVGNETDSHGNELFPVLWSGGHGYDLNTLIAPSPLHLTTGEYIGNQGQIVGHGVLPNGHQRVFLLIRNPGAPLPPAAARPARDLPAARLPHPGHPCGTVQRTAIPVPCQALRIP